MKQTTIITGLDGNDAPRFKAMHVSEVPKTAKMTQSAILAPRIIESHPRPIHGFWLFVVIALSFIVAGTADFDNAAMEARDRAGVTR